MLTITKKMGDHRMKKKGLFILFVGVILILTACGSDTADEETADELTDLSEQVVTHLNNQKYEEVESFFDETMAAQLPAETIEAELEPIINESGAFEEFDKSSIEEIEDGYQVTLVANYSETKRVYTIGFDPDNLIRGFFIK